MVPSAATGLGALAATIAGVADEAGVDPAHVVVLGYSQGAAAALALAFAVGGLRAGAAVVGIAGWLADLPGLRWDLARRHTRELLVHGSDDDVVPVVAGRSAARALRRHDVDVTFVERPGGHALTTDLLEPVRTWLA